MVGQIETRKAIILVIAASLGCSPFAASEAVDGSASGSDAAAARDAAVDAPLDDRLVVDTFSRQEAQGLGVAEVGGPWAASSLSAMSVTGGAARLAHKVGTGTRGALTGVTAPPDVELEATLSCDRVGPFGSGLYIALVARENGDLSYYARTVLGQGTTPGEVDVVIAARGPVGTDDRVVNRSPADFLVQPGEALRMRFRLTGTSPTTLRAKVWRAAGPEPDAWQAMGTDNTVELQRGGQLGFDTFLSSRSTSPVTVSLDDFVARAVPGGAP